MISCEAFSRDHSRGRCPQQATTRTTVEAQGQTATIALCEQHINAAWLEGVVEYWCGELVVTDPLIGRTQRLEQTSQDNGA